MSTLSEAYRLINQPYRFICGNLSVDKKGNAVDPTSSKAVAFDMIGALTKVHNYTPLYEGVECVTYIPSDLEKDIEILRKVAYKAFPKCKNYSLGPINDMLSFDEMVELFTLIFYGVR